MNDELKDRVFTIPNVLTLIRILLIPVFVKFIMEGKAFEGFLIFLIASLTDGLDGFIARFFHQRSKLGQLMDPVADKLLMSASFIILTIPNLGYVNTIPIWLTPFILGRDLVILSSSLVLFRYTAKENIKATLLGKMTTISQMGVLIFVLLFNWKGTTPGFLLWLYVLTLVLTIISWIDYYRIGLRMYREGKAKLNT